MADIVASILKIGDVKDLEDNYCNQERGDKDKQDFTEIPFGEGGGYSIG